MTYYHEGNGMDDTASDGWVASSLAYLTGTCTDMPWTDATSERAGTMSTEDDFTAQISEIGARIGGILRDDMEGQRQGNADRLLALFTEARTRVGGEFAEALLQVMLTVNRWEGEAMVSANPPAMIGLTAACNEILTAIETGLGAVRP